MMIVHSPAICRFETTIDGHTAFLSYQIVDEQTLNYNHTIVPPELGGQGVGTALVKFALDDARASHKKVIPSCSFVKRYIDKHSDYQDVMA